MTVATSLTKKGKGKSESEGRLCRTGCELRGKGDVVTSDHCGCGGEVAIPVISSYEYLQKYWYRVVGAIGDPRCVHSFMVPPFCHDC